MGSFSQFVDKKTREAKKQLTTLYRVLQSEGMQVANHLDDEDPYIFLKHDGNLSFDGVRIYKIGPHIAFRIQKEEETHPFGKAYLLDIEEMFSDLVSDMDDRKAGEEIIKTVKKEFDHFFNKSSQAEKEIKTGEFNKNSDPDGKLTVSTYGADYSSMVTNNVRSYSPL